MKAALLETFGPGAWRTLRLAEVAVPAPAAGDIRVRVMACGLNPVDWKLSQAKVPGWKDQVVLGLDVAGVVDALGEGATGHSVGDRIVYHGNLTRSEGGLAEFALTTAHTAVKLPDSISFEEGAALPCAGLTAYQALFRRLHAQKGQTILVHAAAGGVGSYAVQLAHTAGLRVLGTCSTDNVEFVRSLGADVVIDYKKEDVAKAVSAATGGRGVELLLEPFGPEQGASDLNLLIRHGGAMACLGGLPKLDNLKPFTLSPSLHEISLGGAHTCADRVIEEDLARMMEELLGTVVRGEVRTPSLRVVALEDAAKALDEIQAGHTRGKVVVRVQ